MSNDIDIASLKEKIDELNQQAWEVRVNDSPKAFQLSQESVNLARSINYAKGLAEGLRSMGFGYVRLSKNDEAAPLLRESLSLFQSINDVKGQAVVYEYLGIIERNWGNLGTSLELLLKGYALIQQVGSLEIEVTSCYQIGVTYKHLGNHENALDYLYRALSIAEKSNNALMEAYATNIIGSIYFDNGDYNDALDCYQRGLVIRRESHDKWGEAGSLDNIGFTYLKLNDLDKAIDYCKQSLKITQSTGDKKGEANTLLHLGEIFQHAGDIRQASKFSNESLEIRKARGDKRGEAEVLLFLADLHKNRGDVEDHQIFDWLSGALKIADEIKAQDILSKAYYNLHEYYTQKGNHKESLIQLEAHLQIEKELHKNTINQKISNLEISHKAEVISQRNKELIELNEKIEKANEELKIEASLERVRTVAMSMKKPDDLLSICKILFTELEVLGIKELRNAMINIYNDEKNTFLNYDFSGSLEESITVFSMIHSHPVPDYITKQIREGKSNFAEIALTGDQLAGWIEFREKHGELPDPKLKNAGILCYYFYSVGTAAIGISTLSSITKHDHEVLMRFRNVFDLAYKRYTDINQAEAQAKEAKVEAALERVRATSMAMHHSDDLITVINVIQEQLLGLGFHFHAANFVTDYSEKGYTMWLASPGESFPYKIYVPQVGLKYFEAVNAALEKGSDFATYTLNFEEKNIYFKNLFENSLVKNTSEHAKRIVFESKGMAASVVLLDKVRLNLMNLDLVPFTDEENNILKRFGYVFEQSYTRFLDLQKAEAQAREAQIETALERVRARTMAMQKSDELKDAANLMFQQLQALGIPVMSCGYNIWEKNEKICTAWMSSEGLILPSFEIPLTERPLFKKFYESRQEGELFFVWEEGGEALAEHYKYMLTLPGFAKRIENFLQSGFKLPTFQINHVVNFSQGNLTFITHQKVPGAMDLFIRFAKVFEQTYTRFLDLQKAEAQAREAQIEAGLERVRSRSLAMHHTSELQEVIHTAHKELLNLNIAIHGGSFIAINRDVDTVLCCWGSGGTADTSQEIRLPLYEHPFCTNLINRIKSAPGFFSEEFTQQEKKDFFTFLFQHEPWSKLDAKQKNETLSSPGGYTRSCYVSQHTSIFIINHFGKKFSAADNDILQRFGKVFEQSYTRFLDLQKAEAQAREAQIETGLERVRSKTMAMHKSEEVTGVAVSLNEELLKLGFEGGSTIIIINRETGDTEQWTGFSEDKTIRSCYVPFFKHPYHDALLDSWKKGENFLVYTITGDEKRSLDEHYFTTGYKIFPETDKKWMREMGSVTFSHAFMKYGAIHWGPAHLTEEQLRILQRFSKVFEQSYTRFLDLQKAEAQAREAQIEAALERVRAKVMAMTNSRELNATSLVFGEQIRKLNIDWQFSYFWLVDESKDENVFWITWPDYKTSFTSYTMAEAEEYFNDCLVSWRDGVKIHDNYVPPEGVQEWLDTFQRIADDAGGEAKKIMVAPTFPTGVYYYDAMMKYGSFGICINKPATEEEKKIQSRFATEFERAYTRFLDLKQAEAQAKEAQIETALERVRSRTMGMQRSGELPEAANLLFQQIQSLGVNVFSTGYNIWENDKKSVTSWMSSQGIIQPPFKLPLNEDTALIDCYKAAQQGDTFFVQQLSGEKLISHLNYMSTLPVIGEIMKKMREVGISLPGYMINHHAFFSHGYLLFITYEQVPEAHDIFKRFAKVFEQTYTRFLDLQKAEAQAREAQIELGLERVRARAMAMQKSDELKELIGTVSTELSKLDLILDRCFIMTYDIKTSGATWWMANPETSSDPIGLYVKYHEHVPYLAFLKAWQDRVIKWQYILEGSVKKTWDEFLFAETELSRLPGFVIDNMRGQNKVYLSASFNNFGCLTLATLEPLSDEQFDIMLRFARVFDLTYTRFNDLKQAEAQTREAKIEAALERVRSKAMAMHKSEDLNAAVATVFEELDKLNIGILRCGIAIMDKNRPRADVWITVKSEQTSTVQVSGDESLDYHPLLRGAYNGWVKQEDFYYILEGEDLLSYYRDVASIKYQLPVSDPFDKEKMDQRQFYFNAVFHDGSLFAFLETPITDEAKMVMKRFANVFNLTYKRFLDLQKAEAQTREAKIEAALERVRARALAMQEPEELKDVAQVLRTEMGLLGVEELETCSIYINDETTNKTECWYALKDHREAGKKLVSDHFPLNLNDTWVGREMMNFYRSDAKQVSIVMQGNNRKEWIHYCEEKSIPLRGYYGDIIPDRTYHLYKFSHGAIGAAAAGDISVESWKLLSRAASVFSLAYSRFKDLTQARNDLIKLKEEKTRAEDALTELQATQKQLIQSEKMASLGELTAGIAHEIQNPLNFVNNFSDVSNELLEEMRVELEKGNAAEAKAIAIDVKENLEKILHHGKRADAIVKGMLQHSRTSSGQKELTDINTLAEEYLRLAYHGLRAKDKFFNAKFETHLDPSIDKINVVPQEIGRVILNLINNAFYAVTEKKKSLPPSTKGVTGKAFNDYEPIVTVTTKRLGPPLGDRGSVEIRVADNGNGIPQKALDKIFQPFFTTKPTGQGTGLGLSLSYDIITKGHDGEITVKTKEGEGAEFTITLPVN